MKTNEKWIDFHSEKHLFDAFRMNENDGISANWSMHSLSTRSPKIFVATDKKKQFWETFLSIHFGISPSKFRQEERSLRGWEHIHIIIWGKMNVRCIFHHNFWHGNKGNHRFHLACSKVAPQNLLPLPPFPLFSISV